MPSLSGGGGRLKMDCPIKFLLGVEIISVQLMADHLLFKSFPGGTPHIKGVGMLIGKFELNPYKRPIWAWLKLFLTPKKDQKNMHIKYIFSCFFAFNSKRDLHG